MSHSDPRRARFRCAVIAAVGIASSNVHAESEHIPQPVVAASIPGADADTFDLRLGDNSTRQLFRSAATNLVPGDNSVGRIQLYLRDGNNVRQLGRGIGGAEPNGNVTDIALSADGQIAAWLSLASNLVAGDSNNTLDLFFQRTDTGNVGRMTPTAGANLALGDTVELNADGTRACLVTRAALAASDTNGNADAYMIDLEFNVKTRLSGGANDAAGNGSVSGRCRFLDNETVVFASSSSNLVAGDSNNTVDIFSRRRNETAPQRISRTGSGGQTVGGNNSEPWLVNVAGQPTLFWRSCATNVVPDDDNARCDIFRRDIATGAVVRLSVGLTSDSADGDAGGLRVSRDGRMAVFHSNASNLSNSSSAVWRNSLVTAFASGGDEHQFVLHTAPPGATLQPTDIGIGVDDDYVLGFVSDATRFEGSGQRTVVNNGFTQRFAPSGSGLSSRNVLLRTQGTAAQLARNAPDGDTLTFALSGDGQHVAYYSLASNLVAGDVNGDADAFVLDRRSGAVTRISPAEPVVGLRVSAVDEHAPAISHDGSRVAFVSDALLALDTRVGADIYRWTRGAAALDIVSATAATGPGRGLSHQPAMDASGNVVVFSSTSGNLGGETFDRTRQIYLRDMRGETFVRLSDRFGAPGDADSFDPQISAGGTLVTFCSLASNLVADDTNPGADLFVADRGAGTLTLLEAGDGDTCDAALSASGDVLLLEGLVLDPRTGATPGGFTGGSLGPRPSADATGRHFAGIDIPDGVLLGPSGLVNYGERRDLAIRRVPIAPPGTSNTLLSGQQGHLDLSANGYELLVTSRHPLDRRVALPRMLNLYRNIPTRVFLDGLED